MKSALPWHIGLDFHAVVPFGIRRENTEVEIERVKNGFGGRRSVGRPVPEESDKPGADFVFRIICQQVASL